MKVSEKALAECHAATALGALPMTIDESALDALQELLRSSFEAVLDDKPDGDEKWRGDRPKMLFQSGLVGGLATFQTAMMYPPPQTVSQDELMRAFYFVKAGCDVRVQMHGAPRIFTIYCAKVQSERTAGMDFWKESLNMPA